MIDPRGAESQATGYEAKIAYMRAKIDALEAEQAKLVQALDVFVSVESFPVTVREGKDHRWHLVRGNDCVLNHRCTHWGQDPAQADADALNAVAKDLQSQRAEKTK